MYKNIETIDTDTAITLCQLNRGEDPKVFDWNKAAALIKEHNATTAVAGLAEDWFWTAGLILEDGLPVVKGCPYLASIWATPVILLDEDEFGIECWCWKSESDWNESTLWPQEAIEQLSKI